MHHSLILTPSATITAGGKLRSSSHSSTRLRASFPCWHSRPWRRTMDGPQWAISPISEKVIGVAPGATVIGGMRQTSAVMLLPFLRAGLKPCVVFSGGRPTALGLWAPTDRSKAVGRPFYVADVSAARANTPGARFLACTSSLRRGSSLVDSMQQAAASGGSRHRRLLSHSSVACNPSYATRS
jgi:hypothetical protein